MVQTGYTTPTQRFSGYTKLLRGHSITYIYCLAFSGSTYTYDCFFVVVKTLSSMHTVKMGCTTMCQYWFNLLTIFY